jgi:ABC-2 type transport system permease protein
VAGDAEARRLVGAEETDLALVGRGGRIVAGPGAPDRAVAAVQQAADRLRARAALAGRGLTDAQADAVLRPAPLPVEETGEDRDASRALASIAVLLLYGQLIMYGYWVAAGVVEEKASRVVELLLAAVRPRELLAGKVLGIGIVALAQLLLVAGLALVLAVATDQLQLEDGAVGALLVTLAWFLVGYAFYATAFAMAGALVPRQEEVQNVTMPLALLLIGTFLLALPVAEDPGSTLGRVLSFVPPSAPIVMPVRMIAGGVGALEVLLSLAACLAGIVAVMLLAARVYGRAVLRTGSRVGLAAVLRGGA